MFTASLADVSMYAMLRLSAYVCTIDWKILVRYSLETMIVCFSHLSSLGTDYPVTTIGFIADQQFASVFWGITIDFSEPVVDMVKRVAIGDVKNHNYCIGSSVIRACYGFEAFLSCTFGFKKIPEHSLALPAVSQICNLIVFLSILRVRNLYTGMGAVKEETTLVLTTTTHEVNSDCADVTVRERVIRKTKENARFPNSRVSNQHQLQNE